MKIVIAPDSYKESLSATEVAQAIEQGFREIFPDAQYISVPVADGGEGTVETLITATQGVRHSALVTGPLGKKVEAIWGMSGDGKTAFIEMAAASGLALVPPEKRNPLITTTYGTGELILQALDYGASNIIIGIGGSATNDGGAGMIQALGVRLLDVNGTEIGFGGGCLNTLCAVDISGLDPRLESCPVHTACDVSNPLIGDKGASRIFGPQKGATDALITELDDNLAHYASVIKHTLGIDVKDIPGAGAAGGMGAALIAFLGAELRSGIDIVTTAINLEEHICDCTFVVTGEGRIDNQSIYGKGPTGVAKIAKIYNKPVIGIAGSLSHDAGLVHYHGIDSVFSILNYPTTLEEAFRNALNNIYLTSRNIAATIKIGKGIRHSKEN